MLKHLRLFKLSFILLSMSLTNPMASMAERISVGKGGYVTDKPIGVQGPSDRSGKPAYPFITHALNKPVITNKWWSSLIWKADPSNKWSLNLFALPIGAKASSDGLSIGYPNQPTITPYQTKSDGHKTHAFKYNFALDLTVGVQGLSSPDTRVEDYSDWTVTASWEKNGKHLKATLGHGLPFVY